MIMDDTQGRIPLISGCVFVISMTMAIVTWHFANAAVVRRAESRFDIEVQRLNLLIDKYVHLHLDALQGIQALYAASKSVERDELSAYLSQMQIPDRYPGMFSVHYAEYVAPQDKEVFEQAVRSDTSINPNGYPHFAIHPQRQVGGGSFLVLKYAFPDSEFLEHGGFDLTSDSVRLKAAEIARDTARPQSTGVLQDGPFAAESHRFAVFLPVYKNNVPHQTLEERRSAIVGYVYGAFYSDELLEGIIQQAHFPSNVGMEVYDREGVFGSDRLLYSTYGVYQQAAFRNTLELDIAGRTWTFHFYADPHFGLSQTERILPLAILLTGFFISLMLSGSFYIMTLSRSRAMDLAKEMTKGLHDSEARFRAISDASPLGIFVTNDAADCSYANQAFLSISGMTLTEAVGQGWKRAIHPEDIARVEQEWPVASTHRYLRKDGTLIWVSVNTAPILNGQVVTGYVGTVEDITHRIDTEEELRARLKDLEFMNRVMMDREERILELKEELGRWKSPSGGRAP